MAAHGAQTTGTTTTGGRSGAALASMIVGIIAIPAVLIPILAIVMGIVALVLGINARRSGATNTGQAMAGIICGSIGILLALGIIIAAAASAS
jgi:Domain of unknown function (DUF4190)